MKKTIGVILMALLVMTLFVGNVVAVNQDGPAPNAGDCVPDGSGWTEDHWPDAGMGPAPNAGDGISDGSGF